MSNITVTITPPVEQIVTITMAQSEAHSLRLLLSNLVICGDGSLRLGNALWQDNKSLCYGILKTSGTLASKLNSVV